MTEGDWLQVIGIWCGCFATGYTAGHIQRWYQALSEKL